MTACRAGLHVSLMRHVSVWVRGEQMLLMKRFFESIGSKKHVCVVEEELLAWEYRVMAFPLRRKEQSEEGGLIYLSVGSFNQQLPFTDPQRGRLPDRL